jgi:hypothetical protein
MYSNLIWELRLSRTIRAKLWQLKLTPSSLLYDMKFKTTPRMRLAEGHTSKSNEKCFIYSSIYICMWFNVTLLQTGTPLTHSSRLAILKLYCPSDSNYVLRSTLEGCFILRLMYDDFIIAGLLAYQNSIRLSKWRIICLFKIVS